MQEEARRFVADCNSRWVSVAEESSCIYFDRRGEFYRKWRGDFGINPVEIEFIWTVISEEAQNSHLQCESKHLLWTLNFLRVYDT